MLSEKYLNTTSLICYYFRKRNAVRIIYLLCINVKKVERLQPNNKCKERNNSVLYLTEIKFVTSRANSGGTPYTFKKKNRWNLSIKSSYIIFTLKSFYWMTRRLSAMLSIFSRHKTCLKVISWCFLAFLFLFTRSSKDAWLDMRIFVLFLGHPWHGFC